MTVTPVFHLEGVVRAKSEMSDFEGPLTLILTLLSNNKIEIRDISISLILDQYLAYLDTMAVLDLDIASEFITMASHLMYIKTKVLLEGAEETEELSELISSLEELRGKEKYILILGIVPELAERFDIGIDYLTKPQEYLAPDSEYKYYHEKQDIAHALLKVLGRQREDFSKKERTGFIYPHRTPYPIDEKMDELLARLRAEGHIRVMDIFGAVVSKTELVASFVSVLELCKTGYGILSGTGEDLVLSYNAAAALNLPGEYSDTDLEVMA